jgi:putative flippase GtrA
MNFRKLNTQFIRFLITGVINTGFSYVLYSLLLFLGFEYKLANFIALILGVVFSFTTQSKFVFYNKSFGLLFNFTICWLIIYAFNIFLIGKLIEINFNAYQAGAITLIPITVFSYFMQKLLVFKKIVFCQT